MKSAAIAVSTYLCLAGIPALAQQEDSPKTLEDIEKMARENPISDSDMFLLLESENGAEQMLGAAHLMAREKIVVRARKAVQKILSGKVLSLGFDGVVGALQRSPDKRAAQTLLVEAILTPDTTEGEWRAGLPLEFLARRLDEKKETLAPDLQKKLLEGVKGDVFDEKFKPTVLVLGELQGWGFPVPETEWPKGVDWKKEFAEFSKSKAGSGAPVFLLEFRFWLWRKVGLIEEPKYDLESEDGKRKRRVILPPRRDGDTEASPERTR